MSSAEEEGGLAQHLLLLCLFLRCSNLCCCVVQLGKSQMCLVMPFDVFSGAAWFDNRNISVVLFVLGKKKKISPQLPTPCQNLSFAVPLVTSQMTDFQFPVNIHMPGQEMQHGSLPSG